MAQGSGSAQGKGGNSPALLVVMVLVVVLGLLAFVLLRGNGGHSPMKPVEHALPHGGSSQ